jgi:hypothetical protein
VSPRRLLGALALVVGLAHLPFLGASLEDIDSVNFALGVRDFDVAEHRPHPPGYPVYIGAAKVVAAATRMLSAGSPSSVVEARALAMLSLLAAMTLPFALYRMAAGLRPTRDISPPWQVVETPAVAVAAVTLSVPLVWSLAVRPMSDLPGLALALAAQACLVSAWWWQTARPDGDRRLDRDELERSGRMIVLGALLAGVAIGLRSQTLWLTAPLIAAVLLDRVGRGVAGAVMGATMTSALGALAWAVPLVVVSGGLQAYLAALGTQAGEDFAGGEMLYVHPSPRLLAEALIHTFIDPWESLPLGIVMTALAVAGAALLLWRDRRTLMALVVMGGPYLAFHLLFQDTSFTRYAVPLMPVVVLCAIKGLALVVPRAVLPAAAALSLWGVAVAAPAVAEYAAVPAPAIRVVELMNREAARTPPAVLAMHQTFRRPLEAEVVEVRPQLPSPPRREWLELTRYWSTGQTGTVWFLADPRRTDLALIDPQSRRDITAIRWGPDGRRIFGGMRPVAVDWVRMPPPRWFADEGWSLTPETAGMARLMGRGPHLDPIVAHVRREAASVRVIVGGRHLGGAADGDVRFSLQVDGQEHAVWDAGPGFFLKVVELPAGALLGDGPLARLTLHSVGMAGGVVPTAVEQFDLQPLETLMWAFGAGWHEAEYTPRLGVWHWTSDRATLRVWGATRDVRVTLDVESPRRYFEQPVHATARIGERELATSAMGAGEAWSLDVPLDVLRAGDGAIVIETSQTFVPAERDGGADRRRLGLRVFRVEVESSGLR